jgi:EAL domain-containing protein (putative c-di-GMP-specific phosphodiesterase class I)
LVLHYQPQVALASGRADGVEALVRWSYPPVGLVPPNEFIPLAEHTELIVPLTRWVLEAALRQRQIWQWVGYPCDVGVNLSMANLRDPALPATVAGLLQRYALPPGALHVELTESAVMADPARSLDVLARLAALGLHIVVDDFGIAYSSLAYLKRLPVDALKIDRSFVQHMSADKTDAAIVRAIVGLGHELGLRVVAEGVEDGDTWDLLLDLGCDAAQGFYLSPPLPAEELTRTLAMGQTPWRPRRGHHFLDSGKRHSGVSYVATDNVEA